MRYFGLQVPGPNVDSYMRTFPDGTHLPGPWGAALDGRACGHVRAVAPEEKRLPSPVTFPPATLAPSLPSYPIYRGAELSEAATDATDSVGSLPTRLDSTTVRLVGDSQELSSRNCEHLSVHGMHSGNRASPKC